ncbi:MAG: hypothetical protein AAF791_10410 [Bacteroidota bacterium]
MRLLYSFALVLAMAASAVAQPVPYYGQDSRFPTQTGPPYVFADGAPFAARQAFLSALDPATIQSESFESFSASSSYPGGNSNFSQALTFTGAAVGSPITITATSRGAGFVNQNPDTDNGVYPTDGDNFLFGRRDVVFDFGSTPVNAFGFYLNDVETVDFVLLILDPVGPAGADTLRYGPIPNTGSTNGNPGDGQLNFVGFIDKNTDYETVTVGFPGVGNEGFGFDELVVGELPQVIAEQVTVGQDNIADAPGWRLLSAPLYDVTVDALAQQNLVQGVAGAMGFQGQYPNAQPNIYEGYNGGGRYDYIPASSTAKEFVPGRGIWWYWYDQDITPSPTGSGGGNSRSFSLDGFSLSALGFEVSGDTSLVFADNVNSASNSGQPDANADPTTVGAPAGTVSPADDDFYMIGNPYPRPLAVGAISATGGTLQNTLFIWNPSNAAGQTPNTGSDPVQDGPGSYEVVFLTPPSGAPDSVAVWQGALAEVTKTAGQVGVDVTFSFAVVGSQGSGAPPFYGRTEAEPHVAFELRGTTTSGAETRDAASVVRFREDATDEWDVYDASKPLPPTSRYALLAPMGSRDGETVPHAVLALPADGSSSSVPMALAVNEAGSFTLTWDGHFDRATLTDLDTGATVDLGTDESYTFEAEATDWTERFVLSFAYSVASETTDTPVTVFVGEPTPNPATGLVRLDLRTASNATVSVVDALGRQVRQVSVPAMDAARGTTVTLPMAGLAAGTYAVIVDADGVREARRVTVIR